MICFFDLHDNIALLSELNQVCFVVISTTNIMSLTRLKIDIKFFLSLCRQSSRLKRGWTEIFTDFGFSVTSTEVFSFHYFFI